MAISKKCLMDFCWEPTQTFRSSPLHWVFIPPLHNSETGVQKGHVTSPTARQKAQGSGSKPRQHGGGDSGPHNTRSSRPPLPGAKQPGVEGTKQRNKRSTSRSRVGEEMKEQVWAWPNSGQSGDVTFVHLIFSETTSQAQPSRGEEGGAPWPGWRDPVNPQQPVFTLLPLPLPNLPPSRTTVLASLGYSKA